MIPDYPFIDQMERGDGPLNIIIMPQVESEK